MSTSQKIYFFLENEGLLETVLFCDDFMRNIRHLKLHIMKLYDHYTPQLYVMNSSNSVMEDNQRLRRGHLYAVVPQRSSNDTVWIIWNLHQPKVLNQSQPHVSHVICYMTEEDIDDFEHFLKQFLFQWTDEWDQPLYPSTRSFQESVSMFCHHQGFSFDRLLIQ